MSSYLKIFLGFCISGCIGCSALFGDHGVFRGKSKDYLNTGILTPISIPEGTDSRSLAPLYDIPDVRPKDEFGDYIALGEYEVPRPQPINSEKGNEGVKLQKLGESKWIFLNASTSQVWPRTQNFLSEYDIQVTASNPAEGLIETGDVVFKDDDTTKSRFRILIEKGVHPETTEIHILQAGFAADQQIDEDVEWPESSTNVERERQLLDELANTLAQNVSNNSASLLGQNVGGSLKVEFLKDQKEPTMRLRLPESRARATVSHSLEKEGFVLWDQAGDEGLYYVGFDSKAENRGGFFSGWFDKSFPDSRPYSITQLLKHLAPDQEVKETFGRFSGVSFGETLPDSVGFLVVMDFQGKWVDLVIRDTRGRPPKPEQAKVLLRIIRKNLI